MANGEFRAIYTSDGALPARFEIADMEHPPGNHYTHYRLIVGEGRPGVVAVARRGDAVLMVRQHRPSIGADLWEFPRGSSEVADAQSAGGSTPDDYPDDYADETLIRAGLRELLEETGYAGENARVIGRYFADTSVFPQRLGVILCSVPDDAVAAATDGEVDEVRWIARAELMRMVGEGRILDAHTLAAVGLLAAA